MRRRRAAAFAAMATAALAGCSLAPRYVRPAPPVPRAWPTGDAYRARGEPALLLITTAGVFRDPRLRALVTQALANNRDLRVAYANLASARAQVRVVRANQFPDIGVTASGDYSRAVIGGAVGSAASFALQGGVSSFELDLFGRLANATAAQRDRALASEAAARTVRIGLVADIADAWASYAADQDLLAIARDTVASAARGVTLNRARLRLGIAPRTDVRQAEQILATAQGDVAQQTALIAQDANQLRLLVGAEFDPALLPSNVGEVLAGIATAPAGTSSDVLLRRPDVVEAEYGLRAANADIGVARAQLFPTISLTGLAGFASDALGSLFRHGAFRYTAGGAGAYSIFNAGGRLANVRVSQADRDAALASYERAIQAAFRDVADALADAGTLDARLRATALNTAAAADTATLTDARYRFGIASYLESLDAQRSLYAARRAEVAVRLALAANRVTLYRALGGEEVGEAGNQASP